MKGNSSTGTILHGARRKKKITWSTVTISLQTNTRKTWTSPLMQRWLNSDLPWGGRWPTAPNWQAGRLEMSSKKPENNQRTSCTPAKHAKGAKVAIHHELSGARRERPDP